jgi:diguanylate cyclase (GGDEF)-like protein
MDITERKAAEEKVRQLAHFDSLTQLPNRNLFMHLLGLALAKTQRCGTPLAILFIDLDGFKEINDRLGHDAGDSLLTAFAQRLKDCLRQSDTAARLGGDEFVVLIDDFSEPSIPAIVAQRILVVTAKPFPVATRECNVSASIGISLYPNAGGNIDTLIKSADSAMYRAKQAGKNTYRFWSATTDRSISGGK